MNQYRQKLLNAILYFSNKKVKHYNTTKLCKLLFLFDFTHVKQVGYPAIGLQYHAFEKGPVPKSFWLEIKDGIVPTDFKESLGIIVHRGDFDKSYKELDFRAKVSPDMKVFTPRELKILDTLATIYKDATAKDMSEITHLKNEPWDLTLKTKGKNAPIDYELAIDADIKDHKEETQQSIKEHFEVIKNFELHPAQ